MELEELKTAISKPNKITIILIILFVLTLVLRHENICALIYPAPLKQYYEILGDKTKNFRGQKLGVGHMINFQFKENKKSLGELYSLTNVKFIPENSTLQIWEGEDKPGTWNQNTASVEHMQRFRIRLAIPVPDNKKLEGHTIKGALHFKLAYPVLINYTGKISSINNEKWEKPIAVHIFSKNELDKLADLTNQMMKVWLICLGFFFFPILLIFTKQQRKHQETHPPRVV
ncbi:MAG: hypothetical protein KAJ62_11220 [Desulfobacteraceae bacterium]|nr:hypothetical protein [Desulfobacteraceae bacterium]